MLLGIFRLIAVAWDLSLKHFRMRSFAWGLRLGTFAWDLRLGELDSWSWGNPGAGSGGNHWADDSYPLLQILSFVREQMCSKEFIYSQAKAAE